ncbi:MAG: gliding-motility protein MglA [Proteobacteria bacterium]|nr:gliding-motility protein MglA [Pseudomonadota bacterium]NDC23262.1 gliding-motility protein MglA [Pseudomonadota bacterium]NDD03689.1 gliding-motility protein MglA [Pseudomonadota bacterium]NDG26152.1 gliding-motility protein MglA [Pseudomonadota bacterium]
MSFINYAAKEINCKIVYYGPGLGGKTTNLQYIYHSTQESQKGKMISLTGDTERTLFFDFLPLNIGEIRGFKTRFHLYTVPGQHFYDASRRLVLKGVDGIVFVADSQVEKMEDNLTSLKSLDSNLKEQGYDLHHIPFVFQFNKRDTENPIPLKVLHDQLNSFGAEEIEAKAITGEGVFDTLKAISKQVLRSLRT